MKKKLLSLLTSLMLVCSLAAFAPAQDNADALESTQYRSKEEKPIHCVQGEVVQEIDGVQLIRLDDSIESTCSDMYADTGINATASASFVDATRGKYAYNSLSSYSNGAKRQSFYNAMYNICLSFWNQYIDSTNEIYDDFYIIRAMDFKNYGLTLTEALQTYSALRLDNPAFYFLSAQRYAYTDNYIALLMPQEYRAKSTRTAIQSSIISYADSLRSKIKDNYTNYYKALVINNELVKDLSYTYDSNGSSPAKAEWAHNVYGPAYYKKGVCEAYSKMFQMVLNMANVENNLVLGIGQGNSHAWNMVKLDNGSYYNYDITWNDTTRTSDFIARGSTFFNKEHTAFTPSSSGLYYLYSLPAVPAADYNGTKEMYKSDIFFTKQLTGAKYTNLSYGSATLAWNQPEYANGVYIYQKIDGKYVQIAKQSKGINAYNLQNLEAKTYYAFQLRTYYYSNGIEYVSDKPSTIQFWTPDLPYGSAEIIRFAGSNRYSTAVEISKQIKEGSRYVVIASGMSYADALAGVPLAYTYNAPILLAAKDSLDKGTLDEIKRRGAENAIIIGGTGVISEKVDAQLTALGLNIDRIAGKNRFETSAKIAQRLDSVCTIESHHTFFVYYNDFADALSVSSVAAAGNAPILYINGKGELDQYTKSYLEARKDKFKRAFVIGGPKLISENAEKNLKTYSENQRRLYGSNRYMTNLYVNMVFSDIHGAPCLATGTNFPDALAGGVYAAQQRSTIYLVPPTLINGQVEKFKELKPTTINVFGGTGAVSTQAAYQAAAAAAA